MNQIENDTYQANGISRLLKRLTFAFAAVNFLSMFIVVSGMLPFDNTAVAWCEPNAGILGNTDTYTSACMLGNLSEIEKLSPDRVLTKSSYEAKIEECINGDAGGWDNSPSELNYTTNERKARCANAIVSCQRYAIDVKDCTPNNLKTISGSECNSGQLSGNGNDDCQRLKEMNGAQIDKIAEMACVGEPGDNSSSGKATDDCKSAVTSKCIGNDMLNDDGTVKGNSFVEANKCAQEESRKQAQTSEACKARGGIPVTQDYKDPVAGSNSNVSKGCKNGYGDLINEPACKAAGGNWGKTSKQGQPDAYGCMNPNGGTPDNQNGDNANSGSADGAHGNVGSSTGQCGAARTNLISCKGKGEQALGDILKIIVSVLTVIIGIAATGGLAWAAVLYAKAEDNSGSVSEAKTLITNIVIGILLYGFMVAIINWLVPGGIIG